METEDYWSGILKLAEKVRQAEGKIDFCFLKFGERTEVHLNRLPYPENGYHLVMIVVNPMLDIDHDLATVFRIDSYNAQLVHKRGLSDQASALLLVYLPYCFLPLRSRELKRAIAVSHFAQSLDGRIATNSGDSKWIGNQENLVHAHRMRALCESILIGGNTLKDDQPSLTVRLVEGDNPRRIVICSSEADFGSLQACSDEEILIVSTCQDPEIPGTQFRQFEAREEGRINCLDLLEYLFEQGIHSVYIEGGAATTSGFLLEKATDVVQLHISPMIFGSGVSSFVLPEIQQVEEAIHFERFYFRPMGDTYMFVGEVNHPVHA